MPDTNHWPSATASLDRDGNWHPSRSRLQLRTANAISRRMTEAACHERRVEVDALLDQGVRFLTACKDAGMPSDYIEDTAKGFHDKLADLMAGIDRDLDEAGLNPAEPLCLVELNALCGAS